MTAQTLYRLIYQRAPIKVAMKGMITTLDVCPGNLTFQGVVFLVKAILIRHKTKQNKTKQTNKHNKTKQNKQNKQINQKNQKRKQMIRTKNKKQETKIKIKIKNKNKTKEKQCFWVWNTRLQIEKKSYLTIVNKRRNGYNFTIMQFKLYSSSKFIDNISKLFNWSFALVQLISKKTFLERKLSLYLK